jgi:hypothetical protein
MIGDTIETVCKEIHAARSAARLSEGRVFELGRALAGACWARVVARDNYCPEDDRRVWWGRLVLASALPGSVAMAPDATLEGVAMMLLGLDTESMNTSRRGATES